MGRNGSFAQLAGWRATPERTALMVLTALFVVAGVLATIVGITSGRFVVSGFGVACSAFGWAVSGLIPEPEPDVRWDIRRRDDAIRKYSGHPLPH